MPQIYEFQEQCIDSTYILVTADNVQSKQLLLRDSKKIQHCYYWTRSYASSHPQNLFSY